MMRTMEPPRESQTETPPRVVAQIPLILTHIEDADTRRVRSAIRGVDIPEVILENLGFRIIEKGEQFLIVELPAGWRIEPAAGYSPESHAQQIVDRRRIVRILILQYGSFAPQFAVYYHTRPRPKLARS